MGEWKEAFCPMCGRTMGKRTTYREKKKPYLGIESQENLWEKTREFTGDKPFGLIKSSAGRGSLAVVRYYGIDEDEGEYFPAMKERLLNVIKEWYGRGWITKKEIESKVR